MLEIIQDTLIDGIKLLPFLFVTYLLMEYIEHKMAEKSKQAIQKSGKLGPIIGGILGAFPQCGFSVSATNLYAGRVITLGTLISVYLSTSDEMLPILISEAVEPSVIIKILAIKLVIGMVAGILIDFIYHLRPTKEEKNDIGHLCEEEHCHCDEEGIFKSALKHTINIFLFILLITFIINTAVYFIGEETIAHLLLNRPILGPMVSALIGLIPNCAASVIITNMYLQNVISVASLISGLLTGAGIGLAVLFKTNKGIKQNLFIVGLLYTIGMISGILIEFMGIQI